MITVLLIEDHAIVRAGLGRLLSVRPHIVLHSADTAEEALAKLRTFQAELIILDLNLPGLSGF
ncbi:MAG: response regulator [Rhizomicrobium sp.]